MINPDEIGPFRFFLKSRNFYDNISANSLQYKELWTLNQKIVIIRLWQQFSSGISYNSLLYKELSKVYICCHNFCGISGFLTGCLLINHITLSQLLAVMGMVYRRECPWRDILHPGWCSLEVILQMPGGKVQDINLANSREAGSSRYDINLPVVLPSGLNGFVAALEGCGHASTAPSCLNQDPESVQKWRNIYRIPPVFYNLLLFCYYGLGYYCWYGIFVPQRFIFS